MRKASNPLLLGGTMKEPVLSAVLVALGSGIAIGFQSTLTNWAGRLIGPARTGLLVNLAGGTIAALVILALGALTLSRPMQGLTASSAVIVIAAGALGVAIIAGAAYALPRIGIAAGLATIILGQMAIALLVDTFGWGGAPPAPLRLERLAGLGLLLIGTWLILPRQ
jgi:transporter family-2 protein